MPVIAMTREMGSRGRDVAYRLANDLDIRVVHHEVVEHHLADKLHVRASAVHRYLEGGANVFDRWRIDKKTLAFFTAEEIFELAEHDNVLIRGWGACQLLQSVQHVLCVRVCAPMGLRVRTLMERLDLNDKGAALREIKSNDAAHARTVRHFFGVDWQSPAHYQLVLNTADVPIGDCVELIKWLIARPAFQPTVESRGKIDSLKRAAHIRSLRVGSAEFEHAVALLGRDWHDRLPRVPVKRDERPYTRENGDLL